jgi:hypothetical protein
MFLTLEDLLSADRTNAAIFLANRFKVSRNVTASWVGPI